MRLAAILSAFALLTANDPVIPPHTITAAQEMEPTPFLLDNNIVPKIICGKWMGTGVFVGPGLVATARHVTDGQSRCLVDGHKSAIVGGVKDRDFVLLATTELTAMRAAIDCSGFKEGQRYLASGFAHNMSRTVVQLLVGTWARSSEAGFRGLMIFRGSVTQGMSGGPIIDEETGALVGIINANTDDGITQVLGFPMSETPLCRSA